MSSIPSASRRALVPPSSRATSCSRARGRAGADDSRANRTCARMIRRAPSAAECDPMTAHTLVGPEQLALHGRRATLRAPARGAACVPGRCSRSPRPTRRPAEATPRSRYLFFSTSAVRCSGPRTSAASSPPIGQRRPGGAARADRRSAHHERRGTHPLRGERHDGEDGRGIGSPNRLRARRTEVVTEAVGFE